MDSIKDIRVVELKQSPFVMPFRMLYTQDGKEKAWDLVKVHESVSILIFNVTRQVLVFVRQFRPAVYYHSVPHEARPAIPGTIDSELYSPSEGLALELCAGIVDKAKSLEEIAKEEVLEECGYEVPVALLQKIISSGVGISGDPQSLFYAEVTDAMRVGPGGGNPSEGEFIEVVEMTTEEATAYISADDVPSPGGFLFAVNWFLQHKAPTIIKQKASSENLL